MEQRVRTKVFGLCLVFGVFWLLSSVHAQTYLVIPNPLLEGPCPSPDKFKSFGYTLGRYGTRITAHQRLSAEKVAFPDGDKKPWEYDCRNIFLQLYRMGLQESGSPQAEVTEYLRRVSTWIYPDVLLQSRAQFANAR